MPTSKGTPVRVGPDIGRAVGGRGRKGGGEGEGGGGGGGGGGSGGDSKIDPCPAPGFDIPLDFAVLASGVRYPAEKFFENEMFKNPKVSTTFFFKYPYEKCRPGQRDSISRKKVSSRPAGYGVTSSPDGKAERDMA